MWEDDRNGDYDVYYQRIASSNGAKMCPDQDSAYVCKTQGHQCLQQIIPDGSNGAIITWRDERELGNNDIYAMRFNSVCEPCPVDVNAVPIRFTLNQNVPNPFNPTTKIRFYLSRATHVNLSVYNVMGELIAILVDRNMTEGRKEINWNATNDRGRSVESGIYFYRLTADGIAQDKKMVLLK